MAYRLRVVLDVEEDVFRDILIDKSIHLEDLHFIIAKSFGFKGQEMAAFYRTNENWDQGEEIPLFDMSDDLKSNAMSNFVTMDVLNSIGDKLIYVYDFFSMWTFYVELTAIQDKKDLDLPITILAFGNTPEEAPEKHFMAIDSFGEEDLYDDDSNFENIDDVDFDNY